MNKIITAIIGLLLLATTAEARKVSGTVKSGEEKLSGVIVTDGKNFTQTKKNGKFSFDIQDDAEFVYIVTPAGYVADWSSGIPAFWQRAEGKKKFEFELQKTEKSKDYTIIAIADPQISNQKQFKQFAGAPMDDLCETAKGLEGVAVGLALGDICGDKIEILNQYRQEIRRTGIPFYPVIGNHDHDWSSVGDLQASMKYRRIMGPENYAFCLGKDVVIVIDNIIYDTNYIYEEGYANHLLAWVKGLENLLPDDADLYIAQHAPVKSYGRKILGTSDFLDIVRGRKVNFLSGHTHVNCNAEYERDITEHNVAAFCGTWWDVPYCTDGTPQGYKVFTMKDGRLEWHYKSIGHSEDFQMELYKPGQTVMHPNSVVLNIWDWTPAWKVEWYEDGRHMGRLKPVKEYSPNHIKGINVSFKGKDVPDWKRSSMDAHYFAATPSRYANTVTITVENPFGKAWVHTVNLKDYVDVHADVSGLTPENMEETVARLLDMGVNTLEFGIHVSPDGTVEVAEGIPAGDFIDFAEKYTKEKGYSPVRYHAEMKSWKGKGEGQDRATYDYFATYGCKLLNSRYLDDRLIVGSRDYRILNYIGDKYPELVISYIVDAEVGFDLDKSLKKLKFTPQWLSPCPSLMTEGLAAKCREKGIKLAPRTDGTSETVTRILELNPQAVITSSPEEVLIQTRGYVHP